MAAKKTVTIEGRATVHAIGERLIAPLPEDVSAQLPSRGQVAMVGALERSRGRAGARARRPQGPLDLSGR